jgi:spore germination protein KB
VEKAKISPGQLFALLVLFNMGTAILRVLATSAEKDAWLTILLGGMGGLAIFSIYAALYHRFPRLQLTGYMKEIFGKRVGGALGLFYTLFFIHGAARDLREGGELVASSVMNQTPVFVLNVIMTAAIGYVLVQGIEVLARTGQIFLFILVILGIGSSILLVFSGVIELDRLLPVLGKGLGPVIETTLKQTIQFPHEEAVCFTMILPFLNSSGAGLRAGFAAVATSSLILAYTTALNVAVLGIEISSRTIFPMLQTISLINIGEFIQRLDVIVVLFFYAAVAAATDVFRFANYRSLVFPIGFIILLASIMLSGDFSEQIEEGDILLYTMFMFFGAILPFLIWLASHFHKKTNTGH